MSKIDDLNKARAENREVKSWTCKDCDTMVPREGERCDACMQYQIDVANGLFDDDDDYDAGEECGRWNNGRLSAQCTKAGSEECDWECPYSR